MHEGVATNYNYFRTDEKLYYQTLTAQGRQEFIQQQIDLVNTKIKTENKQRDVEGEAKQKQLVTLLELRNNAKRR